MTTTENKELVWRAMNEPWNQGDAGAFNRLFSPDWVGHARNGDVGIEAFRQGLAVWRRAFPDLHVTRQEQIAEGD